MDGTKQYKLLVKSNSLVQCMYKLKLHTCICIYWSWLAYIDHACFDELMIHNQKKKDRTCIKTQYIY